MRKNNKNYHAKTRKQTGERVNRREFLKVGAAGTAVGITTVLANGLKLAAAIPPSCAATERDEFPNKSTDKCKQFDHKYTVFARGFWDPESLWIENGTYGCANCIASCPYNKTDMWNRRLIARLTELPGDKLHYLMARMDKIFGYGNTFDKEANARWWDQD